MNKLYTSMMKNDTFTTTLYVLCCVGIAAFLYHFFVNLCGPYCFGID